MRVSGFTSRRAPSIAGMLKRSFNRIAVLLLVALCIGVSSFGLVLLGIYPALDRNTQAQLTLASAGAQVTVQQNAVATALAAGQPLPAQYAPGAPGGSPFEAALPQLQSQVGSDGVLSSALSSAMSAERAWQGWVAALYSAQSQAGAGRAPAADTALGDSLFYAFGQAEAKLLGEVMVRASNARNQLIEVAAFGGAVELVLFVGMVVVGRRQDESLKSSVVAPVDDLRRAIRSLRDGHLSEPIETSGPLELRQIGDGLREMAAALAHEREQGRAREMELSLQADQLREAQRLAEQASSAKSEFLSRMSHELRTPLTAIIGFSELMELDEATPNQRASIASILRASNHLLGMVNDVLDITRVEAGRMAVFLGPVQPASVVDETLDLAAPLARTRSITINRGRGLDRVPEVLADHQRLKQVLLNLVVNAIKYNRFAGDVEIGAEWDRRQVLLEVKDSGPGIRAENVAKLFSPFERLQADLSEVPGSGLGLALSRSLVRAMGGSIGVRSRVGKGSTFWVLLPRETPETEPETAAADDAGVSYGLSMPRHLSVPVDAREYGATRTLLYIEDTLSNVTLVRQILTRRPHIELISAMYGSLAVELAAEHQPDMIVLDIHRAEFGSAMMRRLQMESRTRGIPIAVLTSDTTPNEDERLREAGAVECLPQPVNVRRFLDLLDEHLAGEGPVARIADRRAAAPPGSGAGDGQAARSATTSRDADSEVAR